jgi:putative DNA primase/helicase
VEDKEVQALVQGHIKKEFDRTLEYLLEKYEREVARANKAGERKPPRPHVVSASGAIVRHVLDALASMTLIPGTIEPGTWLETGQRQHLLPVANGLLDLTNPAHPILLAPSDQYFSLTTLPYAFDPTAQCPEWEQVTMQNANDEATYQLLQEFAGYCLTDHHRAEQALFLVGNGANGKTVYFAGLIAMLGGVGINVCNGQLEMFNQRFATFQTLGKLLNVADDQNEIDLAAEGEWKKFITGGPMTFERKGKDVFSAAPTAKLIVGCNKLPYFSDKTDGVWRRVLIVEMRQKYVGAKKNPALKEVDHWRPQAAGLLNWAIEGLVRLQKKQWQLTVPLASQITLQQHRDDCNPAAVFLREHYFAEPGGQTLSTQDVYRAYREWMEEQGHRKLLAEPGFNKIVKETFPGCTKSENARRLDCGRRAHVWEGLGKGDDAPAGYPQSLLGRIGFPGRVGSG